jgi:hypothetical protein
MPARIAHSRPASLDCKICDENHVYPISVEDDAEALRIGAGKRVGRLQDPFPQIL